MLDAAALEARLARSRDAFNAHDPDGLTQLLTDDVVVEHVALPHDLHGRGEVGRFYADNVWIAFPDLRIEPLDGPFLHPQADRYVMTWRTTGTNTGPITPPGLAPTGKRIDIELRETGELRGDLVSRFSVMYDTAEFMRQLGLLPAFGSRAEQLVAAAQRMQMQVRSFVAQQSKR